VHRSTSGSLPGGSTSPTTDFCKHIKYCCLHQNFNSARNVVIGESFLDKQSNNQLSDFNRCDQDSQEDFVRGRKGMGGASSSSLGNRFNLNEYTNYSNYSDDEKSIKFNNQFLADPGQQQLDVQPYENTTSFSCGECFFLLLILNMNGIILVVKYIMYYVIVNSTNSLSF
jgi:hypothetical protein